MTAFIFLLLFYCTFFLCVLSLCGYLLNLIVLHFGIKVKIRKLKYRKEYLGIVLFFSLVGLLNLDDKLLYLLIVLFFCMGYIIVDQFLQYSFSDINTCQKVEVSIGAFWAHQAFDFYYKIVLESLNDRILTFERKHDVTFYVRKLILVAPVSCNITGTLDQKDDFIEYIGDLPTDECDQAANINRKYKNPVYKIHVTKRNAVIDDKKVDSNDGVYIVAECPSPLGTLFKTERKFKKEIWTYHRKCFMETLKNLTRNTPCIIVDYDDSNSESLSHVLMTAIDENREPLILIE